MLNSNRRQYIKASITLLAAAGSLVAQPSLAQAANKAALDARLSAALAKQDLQAIREAVAEMTRFLGEKAGVPEVADQFVPIPRNGRWLTADEAAAGFEPLLDQIERYRWWKIGLDPTQLGHALREPAAVVSGCMAACRVKLKGAERSLGLAREAADFLLWAQARGDTGVFPFPASRSKSGSAAFQSAERQLRLAEREGRLQEMLSNGWAVNDAGSGGLQFDNGECGVAMLDIYAFTQEKKYLDSARAAADWALARPLVSNWNFNSFSVYLLARMHRATGEAKYLQAATAKALLGVIPGQLTQGARAGRWQDAHNAKPTYHYIMLRSLAELAIAIPAAHADRPQVIAALRSGLKARNPDFLSQGAPNKDKAMETLLIVNRAFAGDAEFLKDTQSAEALDALARLVSAQARRGNVPLGASEWGHFLEYVASGVRR
jgi:hypothetical protein